MASLQTGPTERSCRGSAHGAARREHRHTRRSTVALVGPSGAGKSTVASLIPRLYEVGSGRVTVDGHDVRELTLQSLRSAIGVVAQDPHLFHATVRENLLYAAPGADDQRLREVCAAARVLEVIERLPDRFDTMVGERGYRLSGGEKQRLAIARMLLKDPAVVVLDEATSSLDAENEQAIQQALRSALEGHRGRRPPPVDDHGRRQIVVLDRGKWSTAPGLLTAGGLYAELYRTLVDSEAADPSPGSVPAPSPGPRAERGQPRSTLTVPLPKAPLAT
ncbi:MAG: ATP-binding cassette domain-containing protein [Microthrixaceae bacterium]